MYTGFVRERVRVGALSGAAKQSSSSAVQSSSDWAANNRLHSDESSVGQTQFGELLDWLDPDPETAAKQYESIRRRLILAFASRRCLFAEDLADETIDRVVRKVPHIREGYQGSPVAYFLGVARKVYMEHIRVISTKRLARPPALEQPEEPSILMERLEASLSQLPPKDQDIVLRYFQADGPSKLIQRKRLASELGIRPAALRLRVHRIVSRLRRTMGYESTDDLISLEAN